MLPSAMAAMELEVAPRRERRRGVRMSLPLVVLVVGVLYFLWVMLLGSNVIVLKGLEPTVTVADWVQWGAGLMLILLLILVIDYARQRRSPQAYAEPSAADQAAARAERRATDELVATAEVWKGLRVLEYSKPPKSAHPTAVYTKAHVPIDAAYVVRIEDLVAESRE